VAVEGAVADELAQEDGGRLIVIIMITTTTTSTTAIASVTMLPAASLHFMGDGAFDCP